MSTPLAKQIIFLMQNANIKSIHQLASKTGVSTTGLMKIIKHDSTPRHETLKKLADFFNVPLADLSAIARKPAKPSNPLADTLNHLMQIHYYGQRDLEKLSGVSNQVINKMSHGRAKNPRPETLKKLADCFSISVDQLTGKKPLPVKYKI